MLTPEVDALVHGIAIQVARCYRTSDRQDLVQQGRLWVLSHPQRMADWLEADDGEAWAQLDAAVRAEMERYARVEKAAVLGYELEDEAYYSADLVEALLPSVFDTEREIAPVHERDEVRGSTDPAISAVWPIHLADIGAAFDRAHMTVDERAAIRARYGVALNDYEIARTLSVNYDAVDPCIASGIQAMLRYLGGARPKPCKRSCKECHGSLT